MTSARGKGFFDFFKRQGLLWKIMIPVALGLLLVVMGSGTDGGEVSVQTDAEGEIASLCSSLDGVGRCYVKITYSEKYGYYGTTGEREVSGVAIVCEGGGSVSVRRRLTDMICALFDIGANRVCVEKLE